MPIAYISLPPERKDVVPLIETNLYGKGWSTCLPPLRLSEGNDVDPDHPSAELVRVSLMCIRRSELLVCVDGWQECEICRIEHKYAVDNDKMIRETVEGQVDIMPGEEFTEKCLKISVDQQKGHCHRAI